MIISILLYKLETQFSGKGFQLKWNKMNHNLLKYKRLKFPYYKKGTSLIHK